MITCTPDRPEGCNNERKPGAYSFSNRNTVYWCTANMGDRGAAAGEAGFTIIHEFAHTCGWHHCDDPIGVPRDWEYLPRCPMR